MRLFVLLLSLPLLAPAAPLHAVSRASVTVTQTVDASTMRHVLALRKHVRLERAGLE